MNNTITIKDYVKNFKEMIEELSNKIDYLEKLAEGEDEMLHIVSIHRECFNKYLLAPAERLFNLYGSVDIPVTAECLPDSFAAFEEIRSSMQNDLVNLEKQIQDVKWLHKMRANVQASA